MNPLRDDEIMRQLAAADPSPERPLSTVERIRSEAALERITAHPPVSRTAPLPRRRRRAWIAVQGALAALVAVVVGVLATAPATAEAVLLEAAESAGAQPTGAGAFWYQRTAVDSTQSIPHEREVWRSAERTVLRDEQGAAFRAWEEGRSEIDPGLVRVEEIRDEDGAVLGFGDGRTLTWDEVSELPTDVDGLTRELRRGLPDSGHGAAWDVWTQAIALLQASPARPEQRRALWQVVARVPGVELLGAVTDSAGRPATAVEADFTAARLERYTLLLDPSTGQVLETQIHGLEGELLYRATVLEEDYRDDVPATDAG